MSLELSLFILGALLVVGWFAAGTHLNVRKGEAALRWLGSSAVELKIENAKAPFHSAQVTVLLEPRDVPLIWWFSRLRGRRDLFIFRGELRATPRREFEAFAPAAWSAQGAARRVNDDHWSEVAAPAGMAAFASQTSTDPSAAIRAASLNGCLPVRLAIRRSDPNLEIQWELDELRRHRSREVADAIQRAAQA